MKLTKETLKQIIKEELEAVLKEEELDEGMRDLFFGGALALGGLAGANKAYDTFNPNQDRTELVDDDYGPENLRNKFQQSSAELKHYQDAAESAAKQGDFDLAAKFLRKYHGQMTAIEGEAKFMTGKDFSDIGANHGPEAVQKDLDYLKSIYGR
tara:strand:+ start:781 stop:1242 length:462 start_codon:yes stop_codon:yes gene_type:complete